VMRHRVFGIAAALAVSACAAAAAHAQQQYGDPSNFPGTYLTQRTTAPPVFYGQPRIDVTYFVDNTFTATEHSLINQAAAVWSNTTASVNLVEVFSAAAATIDFTTTNLNPHPADLANRTITSVAGAGTFPDGTPWRHITNAAITIDSNPAGPYFTGVGPVPANRFDYFSLILREFGFGLGLGTATSDPNSVMDASLAQGEEHRSLSSGDLSALQDLYGTPEPETWALLGIGLILLSFRRKFIS